jgi:hypothetical protein
MIAFFALEAGRSGGRTYRLAFGLHAVTGLMVALLTRLF